jgi:hypothetical protein
MDSVRVRKALVLLVGAFGLWTAGAVGASAADPCEVSGLHATLHVADATVGLGAVPDDDRWESNPR